MKISKVVAEMQKDPEFQQYYQAEGEKLQTAVALYKAREEAGLTQQELAKRANTTQATIARIERGENVSFEKLASIAHAMGKELKVEFA